MEAVAAYERRFRRAGLPLLIEGYSATEDVFTRALPFLTLVFLVTVAGALNLEWSAGANVAAFLGGIAFLLGAFGVLNVLRGRPFRSVPKKVGIPELTAFVLLPAALPLVFGGQIGSAGATLVQQLAVLALTYLVVGLGMFSIVRWAGARLMSQLASSVRLLARAIPLLLIFALVLFVNTEMWQVFSTVPRPFLALVAGLFFLFGSVFLLARLPREVRELERETGTPGPPLRRSQRVNVGLVMFVSHALQVIVVSAAIGLFFTVFGALAIGPEVREAWIGSAGRVLFSVGLLGHSADVTEELLRVSGGIAAFSGLYYAVAMLIDSTYRDEFMGEFTDGMRDTFAARAEYLRLLGDPRPQPARA